MDNTELTPQQRYSKTYYEKNKEHLKALSRNWNAKNKGAHKERLKAYGKMKQDAIRWYKETKGCYDCAIKDWRVLEFDHIPGRGGDTPYTSIGARNTVQRTWIEIQKCEVVCANCHAIRTSLRRGDSYASSL